MNIKKEELNDLRKTIISMEKDSKVLIEKNKDFLLIPLRNFLEAYSSNPQTKMAIYNAVMEINQLKFNRDALILDFAMCKKEVLESDYKIRPLTLALYEEKLKQRGLCFDIEISSEDYRELTKLYEVNSKPILKK